jgi:hypothetical protein
MGKDSRKPQVAGEPERSTLGELIHAAVRREIDAGCQRPPKQSHPGSPIVSSAVR